MIWENPYKFHPQPNDFLEICYTPNHIVNFHALNNFVEIQVMYIDLL